MKRLLLATAAILAATSAHAEAFRCVLTQASDGKQLVYAFDFVRDDLLAETLFSKDGTVTASPAGKRPPWSVVETKDFAAFQSVRDPDWRIIVSNETERVKDIVRSDAILMRGQKVIAKGGCGFKSSAPAAPAAPKRPEIGV